MLRIISLVLTLLFSLSTIGANDRLFDDTDESQHLFLVQTTKLDVRDSINSALFYIRKALESDNMSDLETYARRAQSAAGDAESYSDDINNDEAEWYCNKAYNYLRRARNESEYEKAAEYLSRARKALNDALSVF